MIRPREKLNPQVEQALRNSKAMRDGMESAYRKLVVKALEQASFREVSRVTGLSLDTLQRWKKEASQ